MTEPEIDLARVICPLHELDDPGARGFTWDKATGRCADSSCGAATSCARTSIIVPHAGHPLNCGRRFLAPGAPLILCSSHGALFEMETGMYLPGRAPARACGRSRYVSATATCCFADDVALTEPADLAR